MTGTCANDTRPRGPGTKRGDNMEAKNLIYAKMISILRDCEGIAKDKTNPQQGYKFRGIDDMYNALHPLFKKHGVFILSEVLAEKREERTSKQGNSIFTTILDVKFSFVAEDGSSVSSLTKGEGQDSGDKGTNKALSSALKYTLMQTFLIPTEELKTYNTENDSHETRPAKPAPPVKLETKGQVENPPIVAAIEKIFNDSAIPFDFVKETESKLSRATIKGLTEIKKEMDSALAAGQINQVQYSNLSAKGQIRYKELTGGKK